MHLIEVLEGCGHLRHHRSRIGKVHAADVVALERVHEALGHAVALGAAHGPVDWAQAQLSSDLPGLGRDVGAPVVREELQGVGTGNTLDALCLLGLQRELAQIYPIQGIFMTP